MERAAEGMDDVELTEVVGAVAYSDTQSTLNNLVPDNDIIIVDGNGYLESGALEVSKNNPDTYFMTRNTAIPPDDLPENHVTWNNHHGMVWQAMGYAAGQVMSMEGAVEGEPKVGQVDSLPVLVRKHAVRGAICGLMSTEVDAEFMVNWINSWYAPDKTQRNAETHVENGADVLLNGTNGAIPGQVAAENDIWAVGYGIDMSEAAPEGYATSIIMNIAPILTDGFQAVLEGTWSEFWNRDDNHHLWTPEYWQGEPVIEVASWHDDIPEEVRTNTQEYVEQLRNNEIKIPEIWDENQCPSGESFEVSFPEN
jgi:basic membrane lipoprotein Med (substrate-binding protein (PBP1-ABC) superfamily)